MCVFAFWMWGGGGGGGGRALECKVSGLWLFFFRFFGDEGFLKVLGASRFAAVLKKGSLPAAALAVAVAIAIGVAEAEAEAAEAEVEEVVVVVVVVVPEVVEVVVAVVHSCKVPSRRPHSIQTQCQYQVSRFESLRQVDCGLPRILPRQR